MYQQLVFLNSFDYNENTDEIDIDFSSVKPWDESELMPLIRLLLSIIKTNLIGLSNSCEELLEDMAIHNKTGGLN